MLDNWLLAILPQSEHREFNPRIVHAIFSAPLWDICVSLIQSIQIKTTSICIATTRAQLIINTDVEIDACPFQRDCQLSSFVSALPLELFPWGSLYDVQRTHWTTGKLAMLPQSERCQFDPRVVHDNLSVPLWVVCINLCRVSQVKQPICFWVGDISLVSLWVK